MRVQKLLQPGPEKGAVRTSGIEAAVELGAWKR